MSLLQAARSKARKSKKSLPYKIVPGFKWLRDFQLSAARLAI
jgi:hypothetical protein